MFSNKLYFNQNFNKNTRLELLKPKLAQKRKKTTKKRRKKQRKRRKQKVNLGAVQSLLGNDMYFKLILELLGKGISSKGEVKDRKKKPRGMKLAKIKGSRPVRGGYGLPGKEREKKAIAPKQKTESTEEYRDRLRAEIISENPQLGAFYNIFQSKDVRTGISDPRISKNFGEVLRLQQELRSGSKVTKKQKRELERAFELAVNDINPDLAQATLQKRDKALQEGKRKAEETIVGIKGGSLDRFFTTEQETPQEQAPEEAPEEAPPQPPKRTQREKPKTPVRRKRTPPKPKFTRPSQEQVTSFFGEETKPNISTEIIERNPTQATYEEVFGRPVRVFF